MSLERTALVDLHYFPSVQFFSKLTHFEKVVLEQHEHYVKRSYRNRCHLASPQGIVRLTVPLVKGKNNQMPIRHVEVSYHQPWQEVHQKTIQSLYGNAPFFEEFFPSIQEILSKKHQYLFDLNLEILQALLGMAGMKTNWILSSSYEFDIPEHWVDYRNNLLPSSSPTESPDPSFAPVTYHQVFMEHTGFLPNLSILDLLFCAGPETKGILRHSLNN